MGVAGPAVEGKVEVGLAKHRAAISEHESCGSVVFGLVVRQEHWLFCSRLYFCQIRKKGANQQLRSLFIRFLVETIPNFP